MKRSIAICFLAATLDFTALAADSVPVSEQSLGAKRELSDLLTRYKDQHPSVQAQLRKIEDLERQAAAQSPDSAELRAAKAELAELRRRYEAQLRKVEELERQAKKQASESAQLRQARAEFDAVSQHYLGKHPAYQKALQELEKQEQNRK